MTQPAKSVHLSELDLEDLYAMTAPLVGSWGSAPRLREWLAAVASGPSDNRVLDPYMLDFAYSVCEHEIANGSDLLRRLRAQNLAARIDSVRGG